MGELLQLVPELDIVCVLDGDPGSTIPSEIRWMGIGILQLVGSAPIAVGGRWLMGRYAVMFNFTVPLMLKVWKVKTAFLFVGLGIP